MELEAVNRLYLELLIDDCRNLGTEAIARTPAAARYLLSLRIWRRVYLDHDLGEGETGYDVLTWALERGLMPERVQLVTSNPVGRQNMRAALENAGYVTADGINFSGGNL